MFKFTVWDKSQSYGLFLQNLKFKNLTKLKKIAYYLVFILGYYVSKKLSGIIYSDDDEQSPRFAGIKGRLWKLFKSGYIFGEKAYKVLSFLNFIVFLITGKYQSLNLRLLNIKITVFSIELAKLNKGNISFEFQNRQLIWNTFLEFVIFTLPIFQNSKFQSIFQRLLNRNDNSSNNSAKFNHLKERQCSICYENENNKFNDYVITNPYKTNCGHLYCYVCILGKLENAKIMDEKWKCHRCDSDVEYALPFDDVDENSVLFKLNTSADESADDEQANEKQEYVRSELSEEEVEKNEYGEDYENYQDAEDDFDDEYDEEMDEDLDGELEEAMDL
jgi:peroxin-2